MGLFCDCDMNWISSKLENLSNEYDKLSSKFDQTVFEITALKKLNSEELSGFEQRIEKKINDHMIQFAINYKSEQERMRNK